jgi:hypothetical protein
MQGFGNVAAVRNTEETIEVLLETVFPIWSLQSGYKRRELRFGSAVFSCGLQGRLRRDGDPVQLKK